MSISFVPFQQCIRICAVKIYPHTSQEMFWQRLRQPYGGGGSILLGEWFDWEAFHQSFHSSGPPVSSFWVSGEGYSPGGSESMVGSKLLRRKMIDSLTGRKEKKIFLTLQKRYDPQAQALWIYRAISLPPCPSASHIQGTGCLEVDGSAKHLRSGNSFGIHSHLPVRPSTLCQCLHQDCYDHCLPRPAGPKSHQTMTDQRRLIQLHNEMINQKI